MTRTWKYPAEHKPDPATRHVNDRPPNFYGADGKFFLVRCYSGIGDCNSKYGSENYAPASATGECSWCGWTAPKGVQ